MVFAGFQQRRASAARHIGAASSLPGSRRRGRAARPAVPASEAARTRPSEALLTHDLNNLLAVILNANEALAAQLRAGSEDHELAQLSLDAAERAGDLVRRLMDGPSTEAVAAPACDAADVARATVRLAGLSMPPGVRVTLRLGGGDLGCAADRAALERALLNLCVNAGHAMPGGGELSVAVEAIGDEVAVTVADTGCGMPPEVLARATEAFFTTRKGRGGTGLGLSGVREFAGACGGGFELRSEEGRGTVATLRLPRPGL